MCPIMLIHVRNLLSKLLSDLLRNPREMNTHMSYHVIRDRNILSKLLSNLLRNPRE